MKNLLFVCLLCLGISPLAAFALAAQPPPAANPNLALLTNGTVRSMSAAHGGGYIIGGTFTSVQGTPRANLARLNADGSLDSTWTADVNAGVGQVAISPSGVIYVAGNFSRIAGGDRAGLAKLGADGTLDATWNPSPSGGAVNVLLCDGETLYVGGAFSMIGGQARNLMARFASDGSGTLDSWNPSISGFSVNAMALDPFSSAAYIGGNFSQIGGVARANLARLNLDATGSLDTTWDFPANASVTALTVEVDVIFGQGPVPNLYLGGRFSTLAGQPRNRLGKINLHDHVLDANWTPGINGLVSGIGANMTTVYVYGDFDTITNGPTTTPLRGLAMLDASSGVPSTGTQLQFDDAVYCMMYGSDSSIYFAGGFRHVNGSMRYGLAKTSYSLALTSSVSIYSPGIINAIIALNDGSQIVGGRFVFFGSNPRTNLLKLTSSGLLDGAWAGPSPDGDVLALQASNDNSTIFVGGNFQNMANTARAYIASVSASTAALGSFAPAPDGQVNALALDSTGALYAAGTFTHVGTSAIAKVAKFSSTGSLISTWQTGLSGTPLALAVDPDGDVYIGGTITDTRAFANLIRVAGSNGALVAGWNPAPSGPVNALSLDAIGVLYAGGSFTSIGGQSIAAVAQLNATIGSVYANWHPLAAGDVVNAVAADRSGRVYVGGSFNQVHFGSSSVSARNLIKVAEGDGTVDVAWMPQPDAAIKAIAPTLVPGQNSVTIGGAFQLLGTTARNGLATIASPPIDRIFANAFD